MGWPGADPGLRYRYGYDIHAEHYAPGRVKGRMKKSPGRVAREGLYAGGRRSGGHESLPGAQHA